MLVNLFVKAMGWIYLDLRKYHALTGMLGTGKPNLGGVINDGRCCDLGNFSTTHLSGKRLSEPALANLRSGLVPLFQRSEWKLAESFGS